METESTARQASGHLIYLSMPEEDANPTLERLAEKLGELPCSITPVQDEEGLFEVLSDREEALLLISPETPVETASKLISSLYPLPFAPRAIVMREDANLEARAEWVALGALDVIPPLDACLPLLVARLRQIMREDDGNTAELNVEALCEVDPETGLPNLTASRMRFREEVQRALRYQRPLAIALAAVDTYEAISGDLGRDTAQGTLRGVMMLIRSMLREVDFLGRVDENAFLMLFPETRKEHAVRVVERVRTKLSHVSAADNSGSDYRVTCSFGVAGLPEDTLNGEQLWSAAEQTLNEARRTSDLVATFDIKI